VGAQGYEEGYGELHCCVEGEEGEACSLDGGVDCAWFAGQRGGGGKGFRQEVCFDFPRSFFFSPVGTNHSSVSEHTSIFQAYFHPTPPSTSAAAHEDSDSPLQPPRKKAKKGKQDTSQTRFYLRKVGCPANNPVLIKLDGNKSLSVALRGRVVEEFPTVLVWSGGGNPAGYGIESGALIEVVDEGEEMKVKAEAEVASAHEAEAMKVKQRVPDNLQGVQESRPDRNIPQPIEPREEPASTRRPITPELTDKSRET